MIVLLHSIHYTKTISHVNEYRLVITLPSVTNCFSINFQVFTNNNQHNFVKNHFKFIIYILYKKDKKKKAIVTDQ